MRLASSHGGGGKHGGNQGFSCGVDDPKAL
jgi:hypothetical protein